MNKKWKKEEAAIFLMKVGELLEQGYAIDQVLDILTWEQTEAVKMIIYEMQEELKKGSPFHEVISSYGFPVDIVAYIYFSETCGSLPTGLQGAGELYLKRVETFTKIWQMIRYPAALLFLLFFISIVLLHVLFPQFNQLFQTMNIDFPVFTLFMMQVFRYAPYAIFPLFFLLLTLVLFYFLKFRHYPSKKQYMILYKIPLLSSFLRLFLTYYLSLQFSGMLKGGLSIYEACTVLERQQHFPFYQVEGAYLKTQLQEGNSLHHALEDAGWYRPEIKFVIQHGQSTGKLGEELYYYSERVMQVLERKVKKIVMAVQPVMFCFIGAVVLGMFLSVFLPMFQMMTNI